MFLTCLALACGDDGGADGAGTTTDGATSGGGSGAPTDAGNSDDSGDGSASDETTTTTGDDGSTGGATTDTRPYECPNGVLENDPLPSSVEVVTMDGFAMQDAECSDNGSIGREMAYTFTAPAEGFYEFKTEGAESYSDSIVYLTEGEDCGGQQIACGDDQSLESGNMIAWSNVATWLDQDEVIQVVVDTKIVMGDTFTLTADAVAGTCPDEVITETMLPITIMGSTAGQPNRMTSTCYGEAGDYIYQWTVPMDATYQIDTIGSSPAHEDSVISVIDGGCGGQELACNDDIMLGMDRDAKVEVDLVADQVVTIVVDGWSGQITGPFVLNISIP